MFQLCCRTNPPMEEGCRRENTLQQMQSGLYWSRHSKHRPVRLDRSQMQALAAHNASVAVAVQSTPPRKQTPTVNTKLSQNVALKAKKLESPLKRSIEDDITDQNPSMKKRRVDPTKKKARKQVQEQLDSIAPLTSTPPSGTEPTLYRSDHLHTEQMIHTLPEAMQEEPTTSSADQTPSSSTVSALQQQLQSFAVQQSFSGHSSENDISIAVEQPSVHPASTFSQPSSVNHDEESEFTIHQSTSVDPFMMQLYSNNNDATYFNSYVQTPVTNIQTNNIVKPTPLYLRAPQLQHLQVHNNYNKTGAFNDNTDIHSPCGDNLDSLFSSLFGGESAPSHNVSGVSCDPFKVEEENETIGSEFLGSPFL
ncbi:hypothetical protein AKO1_010731 [Acrasis kona]|uniref:Uncharacterized protein n=1 Tax=Acrasis kona TaxID=1008807 RepID=A0AAW2YQE7_9EUKA